MQKLLSDRVSTLGICPAITFYICFMTRRYRALVAILARIDAIGGATKAVGKDAFHD